MLARRMAFGAAVLAAWTAVYVERSAQAQTASSQEAKSQEAKEKPKPLKMPAYRVDPREFDASEADIRAVCDSAGRELWRNFPDYAIEPFVVTRGRQGPIVLYQRNEAREIVLKLDASNTFWSQYAYQFAHEFCHVLCGFREDDPGTQWFEETLCETASLFVMRAMAKTWKDAPPYANWRDYRDSLRQYADDVIVKRKNLADLHAIGLAAFQRKHADELRKNPTNRELNGAMAVVLLQFFEEVPSRWECVRWLNAEPSPKGETLDQLFVRWHAAASDRQRPTVAQLGKLFGASVPEAGLRREGIKEPSRSTGESTPD